MIYDLFYTNKLVKFPEKQWLFNYIRPLPPLTPGAFSPHSATGHSFNNTTEYFRICYSGTLKFILYFLLLTFIR